METASYTFPRILPMKPSTSLARVAFLCSLAGLFGLWLCAQPATMELGPIVGLLGPAAILLGTIARFRSKNRWSKWAFLLGFFVTLYLPTVWLPFFQNRQYVGSSL